MRRHDGEISKPSVSSNPESLVSTIIQTVSTCLFMLVGIISLGMAFKSIFSDKFLPFHAATTSQAWEAIDQGLQAVIITLLRVSGLGFLVVGLQLTIGPVVNYFSPSPILKFASPALSLLFCVGLLVFNYQLHIRANVRTPWKGSLYSVIAIALGIVLSVFP